MSKKKFMQVCHCELKRSRSMNPHRDLKWLSFPSWGASVPSKSSPFRSLQSTESVIRNSVFFFHIMQAWIRTYSVCTLPATQWTQDHKQGLLSLEFQLAKTPKGSELTLARNSNRFCPACLSPVELKYIKKIYTLTF